MSTCGVVLVNCFPDEREMYAERLRCEGYGPIETCDAEAAHGTVADTHSDIVITDLVLPGGGDGLDFIRGLRADPSTRHVTIVVVSGLVRPVDRMHAHEAGCDVFLPKPCLPDDLVAAVNLACEESSLDAAG
jgi:DNA-binding response OmpR family regulator